jgi:type III pantothenate kinase
MLVAIDIGNSSISTGIFSGDRLLGRLEIPTHPKGDTGHYSGEIGKLLSGKKGEKSLEGVIISSVVPGLTEILACSAKEISGREPLIVTNSMQTGLTFDVERPDEIGSDRIADAVAAMEALGSTVAVVDFGTATTITAVKERRFIGGAILAGLRLMGEALHRGTAKLPSVDIALSAEAPEQPVKVLGKSTKASMISGMIYGTAGAVERILRDIESEEDCRFRVALTGGHSGMMARFIEGECYLEPNLTLRGLRLIYERNR